MDWVSGSNKGAIIGVGVPGFKKAESEQLVKRKLPEVDIITVRDEWSKKTLENYYEGEIHVTACPAFLLDPPEGKSSNRTGVNFRPWPNYPSEIMSYHFDFERGLNISEAKSRYITNIQNICDRLDNPIFIPFAAEDENFARNHLDIDVYPYEFSVKKTLERVVNVDKMVSMRYHSLVFSAITETPTLALAYQPKVAALANRLGVESYLPHDTDIRVRFQHPSGVDRLETLANRNFELMDQKLSNRRETQQPDFEL
jgi:polysaccharide pyruvyl transferase WcaK-like protein